MLSKPISQLNSTDLRSLLEEGAVETLRLEFKTKIPGKHETLKKLSSFANTYGGYLIVGAHADSSDGRLTDLPGVQTERGYKQRIVQWCFESVDPPLTVEVSDPIPTTQNSDKVCYVIYVPESDLAPHFIHGRKGIYVRTDEYSQRFEPQFATATELRSLFDRRRMVTDRRDFLIERARSRFDAFVATRYAELGGRPAGIGARFDLTVIRRFPADQVSNQSEILSILQEVRIPWRQVGFPRTTQGFVSQHESGLVLRPGSNFSILEANVWGMAFYASEIERVEDSYSGIHLYSFLGNLLVFLRHAREIAERVGLAGPLLIQMRLEGIRGVPWIYAENNLPFQGPNSLLDNDVLFSLSTSAEDLQTRTDTVAIQILDQVFFAMNWADLVGDREKLRQLIRDGYRYNLWNAPQELQEQDSTIR